MAFVFVIRDPSIKHAIVTAKAVWRGEQAARDAQKASRAQGGPSQVAGAGGANDALRVRIFFLILEGFSRLYPPESPEAHGAQVLKGLDPSIIATSVRSLSSRHTTPHQDATRPWLWRMVVRYGVSAVFDATIASMLCSSENDRHPHALYMSIPRSTEGVLSKQLRKSLLPPKAANRKRNNQEPRREA